MLYLGAFAVILAAFMTWKEYTSFLNRELRGCRAFVRALENYREKMVCYLDSPRTWALEYCDELLLECGFLGELRAGIDISDAYIKSRSSVYPGDEADEILDKCFRRLGDGYLDMERGVLDSVIERLKEIEAGMIGEYTRRSKAAGALLGACAVGTVIMIV